MTFESKRGKARHSKVGSLLSDGSLVLGELTFKEWLKKIDENMLEYDLEDAYEHWNKNGPRLRILNCYGRVDYTWSK